MQQPPATGALRPQKPDALRSFIRAVARRFTFGPLPPRADGWYIWRLSPDWPRYAYKIVEVADGAMVDTEPMDEYGVEWRVNECKPYGEFRGPVMRR